MKKKLIGIIAFFAFLITAVITYFYFSEQAVKKEDIQAEQVIAANEIQQLIESGETELALKKTQVLKENLRGFSVQKRNFNSLFLLGGICLCFLLLVFLYIYFAILRPFEKLKSFAEELSIGNFDLPLDYERSNYFGKFTWAFDSMRKEITKARSCEREAIENNKTVIATLSHDIKTPIASIRAYAEGLEANMDTTPIRREKYLSVIMKKCDEVSRLTEDLFLHSLSDLDKLKINPETFELCEYFKNLVEEMAAEQGDIRFMEPDFRIQISADKNRLTQITENIINNARKYAKSEIKISLEKSESQIFLRFRDFGKGIPDEDMPFIFDKFYRGKNCEEEQGSGLGLYIVKYLTEKMGGEVLLHNHDNGLEVIISFPIIP